MFNRARENYQKQISNINMKNTKKSSPIKIKQNNTKELNTKSNIIKNINVIQKNFQNKKENNFSQNIILPKIIKTLI